jgi:hypothetical protein
LLQAVNKGKRQQLSLLPFPLSGQSGLNRGYAEMERRLDWVSTGFAGIIADARFMISISAGAKSSGAMPPTAT